MDAWDTFPFIISHSDGQLNRIGGYPNVIRSQTCLHFPSDAAYVTLTIPGTFLPRPFIEVWFYINGIFHEPMKLTSEELTEQWRYMTLLGMFMKSPFVSHWYKRAVKTGYTPIPDEFWKWNPLTPSRVIDMLNAGRPIPSHYIDPKEAGEYKTIRFANGMVYLSPPNPKWKGEEIPYSIGLICNCIMHDIYASIIEVGMKMGSLGAVFTVTNVDGETITTTRDDDGKEVKLQYIRGMWVNLEIDSPIQQDSLASLKILPKDYKHPHRTYHHSSHKIFLVGKNRVKVHGHILAILSSSRMLAEEENREIMLDHTEVPLLSNIDVDMDAFFPVWSSLNGIRSSNKKPSLLSWDYIGYFGADFKSFTVTDYLKSLIPSYPRELIGFLMKMGKETPTEVLSDFLIQNLLIDEYNRLSLRPTYEHHLVEIKEPVKDGVVLSIAGGKYSYMNIGGIRELKSDHVRIRPPLDTTVDYWNLVGGMYVYKFDPHMRPVFFKTREGVGIEDRFGVVRFFMSSEGKGHKCKNMLQNKQGDSIQVLSITKTGQNRMVTMSIAPISLRFFRMATDEEDE